MSELSILAIAIGGAFGAVSRFLVAREMGRLLGNFLPYGTLIVKVLGSLPLVDWPRFFWIVRNSTLLCGSELL